MVIVTVDIALKESFLVFLAQQVVNAHIYLIPDVLPMLLPSKSPICNGFSRAGAKRYVNNGDVFSNLAFKPITIS